MIGADIYPTLEVAVKPMSMSSAKNYFSRKGFQGAQLSGKQDLSFKPRKEITWSHFLASVLHFRHKYRGKVFSTSIRLNLNRKTDLAPCKDIRYRRKPFNFDYTELETAFGKTVALPLANHFYSFNGLFQNPLCGSAFLDMMDYLPYIRDTGNLYHLNQRDAQPFAQRAMEALRYGAELRSYGTYDTIEEVTGRFSEFRGGCQQALLAIEFLPSHILERLKIGWKGFVIIGYQKFFHVNEVINVPTEDLWNPQSWWPLFHEIAHIVIDNRSDWIDYNLPLVQQFLANKDFPESWFMLLIELVAEVIGFELGFFGDYRLFFEQLWNHLVKIEPFQRETVDIRAYVNRSFFAKIFEGHFRKLRNLEHITEEQFQNLDYLYKSLVTHMDLIEKTIGKDIFKKNKYFLAAENALIFKELYPYACYLYKEISKVDLRPNMKALTHKDTKEIVRNLREGRIWSKEIASPEAVLYRLMKGGTPALNVRVATILSFWNQQMGRIRTKV